MTDNQKPTTLPSTWLPTTPSPKNKSLSSTWLFLTLFVILLAVAIPVVYLLPSVAQTPAQRAAQSNSIFVPEMLSNCAFFYQLCPTSSAGVAGIQTVEQKFSELSSPLVQSELFLYSQPDSEQSSLAPASQIVTLVASKYNLNPFLLLTLVEMNQHLVTQPAQLRPTIEAGGEHSGDAWFGLQIQSIAAELQQLSATTSLAPNTLTEKTPSHSISIGAQQIKTDNDYSLATHVLLQYLARHSTSKQDLETKIQTFSTTYKTLWGLDPSTVTRR